MKFLVDIFGTPYAAIGGVDANIRQYTGYGTSLVHGDHHLDRPMPEQQSALTYGLIPVRLFSHRRKISSPTITRPNWSTRRE